MNNLILSIENKIKKQEMAPELIEKIDFLLLNKGHCISENEKEALSNEKEKLRQLLNEKFDLDIKYKNFFYTIQDIREAPPIGWLVDKIIPMQSIGVLIGESGTGKTNLAIKLSQDILSNHDNVYLIYIDGDMSINKIKELGVAEMMSVFGNRFRYAGKMTDYFSDSAQELLRDIVSEQKKHPERVYFVIEDSLTLTARKKRGFIDTEYLYKFEKKLREVSGAALLIHHTNKAGVFADSQQIENYADYTYIIERNDFNSCILLKPKKASRFDIQRRAYLIKDRKIVKEVNYDDYNVSEKESKFVNYIIEALEDGEMNQSELLAYLEKMRFFNEYKVGQKKAIRWLKEWGDKKKWKYEQKGEKNAIYYCLDIDSQTEKLAKLPNNDLMEIQNGY